MFCKGTMDDEKAIITVCPNKVEATHQSIDFDVENIRLIAQAQGRRCPEGNNSRARNHSVFNDKRKEWSKYNMEHVLFFTSCAIPKEHDYPWFCTSNVVLTLARRFMVAVLLPVAILEEC